MTAELREEIHVADEKNQKRESSHLGSTPSCRERRKLKGVRQEKIKGHRAIHS
jgi:hypothetical protein